MSDRVAVGEPQPQGPGEDPLYHYTRLFVRFLQLVFGTFEKGNYRWDLDELNSDIIISDQARLARETVEKRPAILVARGPVAYGNIAMDQFAGPHLKNGQLVPNFNMETGARRHTDLCSSSVSFSCLSKEGIEAGRLAHISAMAVRRLKRSLMKAGLHRVGEEIQIGSESAPGAIVQDADNEIVMVSVTVPFFYQDFWTVEPADKSLLKHIDLALTSRLNFPAAGAVPIKEPGMNGKTLTYDKVLTLTQRSGIGTAKTPKPRK
jgi:hypothetical protein